MWGYVSRFLNFPFACLPVMIRAFLLTLTTLASNVNDRDNDCNMLDEVARQQKTVIRNYVNSLFVIPLLYILRQLYYWMCFWYITLPLTVIQCIWNAHLVVLSRRSAHVRRLVIHSQRIRTIREFS